MVAIAIVTVIPALLALIYIGSSTVFEDVVSLSTSGLYMSYFIPCSLLLWRRVTGQMVPPISHSNSSDAETALANIGIAMHTTTEDREDATEVLQHQLVWGPWRLPGWFGIVNNSYACVYILFVIFWGFWPPEVPATAENMNYSVLMTGAALSFSVVYYYIWGKEQYLGPLIERGVGASAGKSR